jgi:hypothetical protein
MEIAKADLVGLSLAISPGEWPAVRLAAEPLAVSTLDYAAFKNHSITSSDAAPHRMGAALTYARRYA